MTLHQSEGRLSGDAIRTPDVAKESTVAVASSASNGSEKFQTRL
jgi:hypothetical protein